MSINGVYLICYVPFTYTVISYESLRIAHIYGSLRLATFTSCYELFTVYYGLLRAITMYLRQNSTICYELSRITTSNLRVFYELFTDCYEYITGCYYSSKFLRVVTNSYELVTSIYESLRFVCQKIYKSCKSQCMIIRQVTPRETTWHMRETDCSYINNFCNCSFN